MGESLLKINIEQWRTFSQKLLSVYEQFVLIDYPVYFVDLSSEKKRGEITADAFLGSNIRKININVTHNNHPSSEREPCGRVSRGGSNISLSISLRRESSCHSRYRVV